ncbi:MAG: glucuronate isomerase [Oscillospiraceae bacterium]|jgi:glucuronate isomerase|nr:glucuronate isomerase [Oscillospiraceae bacterium]
MVNFMNEDFLLKTESAARLYHEHAEKMPVIDYHCHINPEDIARDKRYTSISDVWLGGDHYKWRLIRANGTPESGVTGALGEDPFLLFQSFAAALPRAIGNPVYHWTYLELKRYFGIEKQLTPETAREIFDACNKKLAEPGMSARGLIDQSNVRLICTTDDPTDNLEYHRQIAGDKTCKVKVLPAFRPDKAVNIRNPEFAGYIAKLAEVSGVEITDFASLCRALDSRIDFFNAMGCRASDHGLESCIYATASQAELDAILSAALGGEAVSPQRAEQYSAAVLLHLGRRYHELGWVMQIHFGCKRNNNSRMFRQLGADTGFDSMNGSGEPYKLSDFLDALDCTGQLPRMVLYSLNPADSEIIATIAGCFMADAGCPGKIQLGAAWWFNDTKSGMEKQLLDYANGTLLGNFVGMLTDSRSFLSYTRHEYFRRILCNFLGKLVEDGEYAADFDTLGRIVEDICYNNTARFFGFGI